MSAFVITGVLSRTIGSLGGQKRAVFSATGTASYDTNGSVASFSTANATLTALDADAGFTRVDGVNVVGVNPHGSAKYKLTYIRAASGAPATGTFKVIDCTTDPGAEVASTTDLSATTFFFEVFGT